MRASNFQLNVAEGVSYLVAMGFMSPVGVLPLFVSGFTDAKWALGLLGAVTMLGALPQAAGVSLAARAHDFLGHARLQMLLPRLALAGVAIAPWLPGQAALVGFFALFALFQLMMGFATPAWLEFVHLALPARQHGAFFGRRTAWGAALSLGAMGLASLILATLPSPWSFRLCFALAALAWGVTYPCVLATRIAPAALGTARLRRRPGFLAGARRLLAGNAAFRRYLVGRSLLAAAGMAGAFYVVHGATRYQLPMHTAALLPIATSVLPALAGDVWGRWIDRRGAHAVLVPVALAAAAAHVVMLAVPSAAAYVAALAVVGTAGVVLDIAQGQFLLGLGAEACGVATSVLGLALLPVTAGAPLLAGFLADAHGMPLVLGLAGLAWLAGALALAVPLVNVAFATAHPGRSEA